MLNDRVVVECFEAAAQSKDVLATKGALVREFPAHGLVLPVRLIRDETFVDPFCYWLSLLDSESVEKVLPQTKKAGTSIGDVKETADPVLVTDMLMAILAAVAEPYAPDTIRKRVRDDILCRPGQLPWRRSSLWLTLRVTLQMILTRHLGAEQAMKHYKNFMVQFLTTVAERLHQSSLSSELSHTIAAKIARRISKARLIMIPSVLDHAIQSGREVEEQHRRDWEAEISKDCPRRTALEVSKFEQDTCLTLLNSKDYIMTAMARGFQQDSSQPTFVPSQTSLLLWANGLPALTETPLNNADRAYALGELEQWLQEHLATWTEKCLASPRPNYCTPLAKLADQYYERAKAVYKDDVSHISTMIISLLQIWYAVDRLAIAAIPLLGKYPPELQAEWFEPLLLPELWKMEKLQEIERHIIKRHADVEYQESVFGPPGGRDSFTHNLYNLRASHYREIKKKIEEMITAKSEEKDNEWTRTSQAHGRLLRQITQSRCQLVKREEEPEHHDANECPKCQLKKQANEMEIEVFEYPLPESSSMAASIIVELDCPPAIVAWRNVTWLILHDLGRKGGVSAEYPKTTLGNHPFLQNFYTRQDSRVNLASFTQPTINTRAAKLSFPVDRERCKMKDGIKWELMDCTKYCWVSAQKGNVEFGSYCTPSLADDGLYRTLQFALGTRHSQNEVISKQNDCPPNLTLQAYLSYGSLRADGERIQWLNIARELKAPHLNLNSPEVVSLFLQAAWQAGPASDSHLDMLIRNAHQDLRRADFTKELLTGIENRFSLVLGNWKSDEVMRLLIALTLRILSLSVCDEVAKKAFNMLSQMRETTFKWTQEMSEQLCRSQSIEKIRSYSHLMAKSALLCKMTFAVDPQRRSNMMQSHDSLKHWIYCSVRIGETVPRDCELLPLDIQAILVADQKLSQSLLPTIRDCITREAHTGLDHALSLIYTDMTPPTRRWTALDPPNDRWVQTSTSRAGLQLQDTYHYDIVDARFLINGQSSNRLPDTYASHELYARIFGDQVLSVIPSRKPGFVYMTCNPIEGHTVHFALFDNELVIRLEYENSMFEVIPHNHFTGDVPLALIEGYTHWLNLSSKNIEFRPLKRMWTFDSQEWHLMFMANGSKRLHKNRDRLVDPRSQTHGSVMEVFKVLDNQEHVQITISPQGLEVWLTRFDLHFSLKNGTFYSRELGKMIDPNQQVGTFIGLKNKLVLCGVGPLSQKYDRTVLVPDGNFIWSRGNLHVSLQIEIEHTSAKVFQYDIDPILQRLNDRGDREGILFKAYVHALTSHFLADPLTRRTGTEEALWYLRRRSLKFMEAPTAAEASLLSKLARITPSRSFKPPSVKFMQQVKWDSYLPSLSQHVAFLEVADELSISSNDDQHFEDTLKPVSLYLGEDRHLQRRAGILGSQFYAAQLSPNSNPRQGEKIYRCRDRGIIHDRSARSLEMSILTMSDQPCGAVSGDIYKFLKKLERVEGFGSQYPIKASLNEALEFDLKTQWASLINSLKVICLKTQRYAIMFLMGILAYGEELQDLMPLKHALAFAFSPELRRLKMPTLVSALHFKKGTALDVGVIKTHIESSFRKVGRKGNASERNRRREERESAIRQHERRILAFYQAQWPCASPTAANEPLSDWFDRETANELIKDSFSLWIANDKFGTYFQSVQSIFEKLAVCSTIRLQSCGWRKFKPPALIENASTEQPLANLMTGSAIPTTTQLDVWVKRGEALRHKPDANLTALLQQIDVNGGLQGLRKEYQNVLLESNEALSDFAPPKRPKSLPKGSRALDYFVACETAHKEAYRRVVSYLEPQEPGQELLRACGLWPRCSIQSLLKPLASISDRTIHPRWKRFLVRFGQQISYVQRARRIMLALEREDLNEVYAELENDGPDDSLIHDHPDWLLMELHGDFLARESQIEFANEMITPASGINSLIQLNMGELDR